MKQRRYFTQTETFKERLAAFADGVRVKASKLRPGPEQEALLRKARQADTAAHLNDWANSPERQPPK
jgi:hypothetical protein